MVQWIAKFLHEKILPSPLKAVNSFAGVALGALMTFVGATLALTITLTILNFLNSTGVNSRAYTVAIKHSHSYALLHKYSPSYIQSSVKEALHKIQKP